MVFLLQQPEPRPWDSEHWKLCSVLLSHMRRHGRKEGVEARNVSIVVKKEQSSLPQPQSGEINWRGSLMKAKGMFQIGRNESMEAPAGHLRRQGTVPPPSGAVTTWVLRRDGHADVLQHEDSRVRMESNPEFFLCFLFFRGHVSHFSVRGGTKGKAPAMFKSQALFPVLHIYHLI